MISERDYYKISEPRGLTFAATFLLVQMQRHQKQFPTRPNGSNFSLREPLELLAKGEYITPEDKSYKLTGKGVETVEAFESRYSQTLTYLDIFSSIDLQSGDFAFEQWGTFTTDEEWQGYLADPRWSDLRVAIIDYLDGDASEFVFSQLTLDGELNTEATLWQQNLTRGRWWRDIQKICDTAIQEEDLGYSQDGKTITGEDVLDDVFEQGIAHLRKFFPEDATLQANLTHWYPEEAVPNEYGAARPTDPNKRPPWETPWTL